MLGLPVSASVSTTSFECSKMQNRSKKMIRTTFCSKTVDETKPKSHVSFEDFFRLNKQNASSSPECDILRHMYMSPIVQHWLQQSIAPKKYLGCPIDLPHLQGGAPTIPRHCSLLYLRTHHHHQECFAAALNFVGQLSQTWTSRSLSKTWKFFETSAHICEQSPLYVQWLILIICKAGKAPSKRELWNKQRYFVWNNFFRLLAMI